MSNKNKENDLIENCHDLGFKKSQLSFNVNIARFYLRNASLTGNALTRP